MRAAAMATATSSATASTSSCCGRTSSTCVRGARMARHPSAAAHGGHRAQVAHQCRAGRLRAAAPVDARRACWATSAGSSRTTRPTSAARGIKFYKHPGAHLKKKPGRWIVAAELVETTRLFGRGIANIEPQWLGEVGGHLLKKQSARSALGEEEAHAGSPRSSAPRSTGWWSTAARSVERFSRVDPHAALPTRIFHTRGAGWRPVGKEQSCFPFLAASRKLNSRKSRNIEHKSRRQDIAGGRRAASTAFYDAAVARRHATAANALRELVPLAPRMAQPQGCCILTRATS